MVSCDAVREPSYPDRFAAAVIPTSEEKVLRWKVQKRKISATTLHLGRPRKHQDAFKYLMHLKTSGQILILFSKSLTTFGVSIIC